LHVPDFFVQLQVVGLNGFNLGSEIGDSLELLPELLQGSYQQVFQLTG
jgi:hypothetical protein